MFLDLSKKEHIPLIRRYPKCKGIQLANEYLPHLNPLNKMYIIDSVEEWKKVEEEFPEKMMTVRCDCPKGIEAKLPSGQTFDRSQVEGYINQVKCTVPEAVIMLEEMKPGTNERIYSQGAVCLDVDVGNYVYMDYVGPCFDCGDITKGKSAHETWNIPWEEVLFLKSAQIRRFLVKEIRQQEYESIAQERIKTLINWYPKQKDEIIKAMPKTATKMPRGMFEDIVEKVIVPLYLQKVKLSSNGLRKFGLELNIAPDGTIVPMELQVPERFQSKEDTER